jgi:hypothetical protein
MKTDRMDLGETCENLWLGGAKINRAWSAKGVPTKTTRDDAYYFEFRKDGKWYFAGVVGD